MSRSCNNLLTGRSRFQLLLLLLAALLLGMTGCQSSSADDAPAGPAVQGPALVVYFADN